MKREFNSENINQIGSLEKTPNLKFCFQNIWFRNCLNTITNSTGPTEAFMTQSLRKKFHQNENGFTLIELILVIVILGILAAVALPKFIDLRGEAQTSRAAGALAALRGTVTLLHAQNLITATATYDIDSIVAGTDIQGGTVSTGATTITIDWGDVTNTFTYTASTGLAIPAEITN